ncbi:MAG: transketolase [bacterium]
MKIKPTKSVDRLNELAKLVRADIIESTTRAGSGHPSTCLSAVDLMVGLMFSGVFKTDLNNIKNRTNDRLIFSKGHAAPLIYSLYSVAGKVSRKELMSLRKFGSRLQGHPMPDFPYTEVPTGSLGQGLSTGLGMALQATMDNLPFTTYVLLGDGEMSEGSVWEAIDYTSNNKVDNLVGILDINGFGQSGHTRLGHDIKKYFQRIKSFGWNVLSIDGHNMNQILAAYQKAKQIKRKPTMILASTLKGKGVSLIQNKGGWHGKALSKQQLSVAMAELGDIDRSLVGSIAQPIKKKKTIVKTKRAPSPRYSQSELISTRKAFGNALVRLALQYPEMTVLDGDVKNSTYTEAFGKKYPDRFIQAYIAEQNMVGMAGGLAARGKLPVASTFAAFFTRAFDHLRMAQYAQTRQIYVGTHAGVHIGEDGPSQMGLEDIAMFSTLQNSTVLYPSDAVAMEKLLELSLKNPGLTYLRATRGDTPVIYNSKTDFKISGSQVVRSSTSDKVTIVAAGITLFEALTAADLLAKKKIPVRVIDLYSIKPIDKSTLQRAARVSGRFIVVEDHRRVGGLAEAVQTALGNMCKELISLSVEKTPKSGRPEQLLKHQGIDAQSIIRTVERIK